MVISFYVNYFTHFMWISVVSQFSQAISLMSVKLFTQKSKAPSLTIFYPFSIQHLYKTWWCVNKLIVLVSFVSPVSELIEYCNSSLCHTFVQKMNFMSYFCTKNELCKQPPMPFLIKILKTILKKYSSIL